MADPDVILVDASGNGNHGYYGTSGAHLTSGTYTSSGLNFNQTGLVPGNAALGFNTSSVVGDAAWSNTGMFNGDMSFVCWFSCSSTAGDADMADVFDVFGSNGSSFASGMNFQVPYSVPTNDYSFEFIRFGDPFYFASGISIGAGTHMIGMSYSYTYAPPTYPTGTFYLDGTSVGSSSIFFAPNVFTATLTPYVHMQGNLPGEGDEYAFFPSQLSSTDMSNLYAAGTTSFAAWDSAVLALSPSNYYHLDATGPHTSLGWYLGAIGMSS